MYVCAQRQQKFKEFLLVNCNLLDHLFIGRPQEDDYRVKLCIVESLHLLRSDI